MRAIPGIAFAAALAAAGPAFADAVVYSGTVGTLPVILELTAPPGEGAVTAARYAYMAKGTDIPLTGVPAKAAGALAFEEEAPCTLKLCGSQETEFRDKPPVAADWTLDPQAGGGRLAGTWRDRKSGKTLPVALERRATRPIDTVTHAPLESLDPTFAPIEHDTFFVMERDFYPYDFLKLDWPLVKGREQRVGDGTVRMDTDPRVDIAYPVVASLGGTDTSAVNEWLRQGRLQVELPAFGCRAAAYLGFGWRDIDGQGGNGYDATTVTVDHLSPRLIGLTETGSYWCGGAHPDNFEIHRLADVRSGALVLPERLLAGWQARDGEGNVVDPAATGDADLTYGPSDELVAYVNAHRRKFDAQMEGDCGMDDLVKANLGVYFRQDSLVFTLVGLPHVIFACTEDLLEVPLKDARPLLTAQGAGYFEALDR